MESLKMLDHKDDGLTPEPLAGPGRVRLHPHCGRLTNATCPLPIIALFHIFEDRRAYLTNVIPTHMIACLSPFGPGLCNGE